MALVAILTTVGGKVSDLAVSATGSDNHPVAETSAGYLRPPVLISTVPSVLARQQAELQALSPTATAGNTAAPQDTPGAVPQAQVAYFTYTVLPGDSVSSIAQRFGINEDYVLWNNPGVAANPDVLLVGATVLVPSTNGIVYNVTVGDTLNDIAGYYSIDAGSVVSFGPNGLTAPDSVVEGMTLLLPGAVPPAPIPAAVAAIEDTPDPAPEPAAVDPEPVYVPPPAAPVSSVGYIWPVYGAISTYFDWGHPGIDIDGYGQYGAPIAAAASGTVVLTAWDSWGYGYHVIVEHEDGSRTLYAHLSDIWVSQGQWVNQGEAVGALGSTGYSTGAHLMFNLYIGGVAVDPLAYLP
jgi:murein DD-endopeptidase MepM/ murein hydrolase activator NlpD